MATSPSRRTTRPRHQLLLTAAPLAVLPLRYHRSAAPLPMSASRSKRRNPKLPGWTSHARYEVCKVAAPQATFRALGGSAADYAHDIREGNVKLLSS